MNIEVKAQSKHSNNPPNEEKWIHLTNFTNWKNSCKKKTSKMNTKVEKEIKENLKTDIGNKYTTNKDRKHHQDKGK
ncbi:23127_t:CDS:2 [Gigaspora margarita]|uniref:23127_t:CDS:1 n=1 Tax=Gigaspora margarita TaxID=4874 RepID=A0ABN7UWB1_GIGMA|nr:23127_t:CDS:2 [Gigaspora margarita]